MRDGEILADDTPDGLLASTATEDVEAAFLNLIRRHPSSEDPSPQGPSDQDPATRDPSTGAGPTGIDGAL
jgi:hypothetical protein